jgi:cytochrome bd-type quinol oxidase subunit 2
MKLAQIQVGNIGGLPGGYQDMAASAASSTLEKIISNTLGFLTIVGGISFIIYTVLAGLTWITAREEGERLSKAKQMFTNALIGLALVVISWALAGVISTIFGFEILNPGKYIEIISPGGGNGNGGHGGG